MRVDLGRKRSGSHHETADYLFQVEVPFVDPFDLVAHFQAHADVVLDHQARQFVTIDQDDAFRTSRHIVPSRSGETGGGGAWEMGPKNPGKWGPIPFHTLAVHLAWEMGLQIPGNFPFRKAPLTRRSPRPCTSAPVQSRG